MVALCLGCLAEAAGYYGRVVMHNNPYDIGFQIQISLIISSAFVSASICPTLKHFKLTFGESLSRLRPEVHLNRRRSPIAGAPGRRRRSTPGRC
ncbi:hypothetical protein PMIN06_007597 [Paraphaeosphaeria minitans]